MKKLGMLLAAFVLLFASTANASLINGVNLGEGGDIKMVTSVYFNTDFDNNAGTFLSYGIGDVQRITDGDGVTLWENGNNGSNLYFYYENLFNVGVNPISPTMSIFYNIAGVIDFFTTGTDMTITGDYAADKAQIAAGDLFFSGTGDEVGGYVNVGTVTDSANIGFGQFEVVDELGAAWHRVDQQAIPRNDGTFTDFTFNYSSDLLNTAGYHWAGSADISMVAAEVSAPVTIGLFALALVFLAARKVNAGNVAVA